MTMTMTRPRGMNLQAAIHNFGPLAILMVIAATMSDVFFSTRNLFNVLRKSAARG